MAFISITHHHHHDHPGLSELLKNVYTVLTSVKRTTDMLTQEMIDLMAQAEKNVSLTESLDLGFKAMALQINTLQGQVAALQGNGVITDAEKAQIVQTTSDLAASFSTLQVDIPANTPAAPPAPVVSASPPSDPPPPAADAPPAA